VSEQTIQEDRLLRAEASKGVSSAHIHRQIVDIIAARRFSGAVLDYGAGTGNLSQLLCSLKCFSSVKAADILERPAALSSEVPWLAQDLNQALPLPDASLDLVAAAEVIEHLENPRAVVRDWRRMLKPGGSVIFSTPNNESIRALLSLLMRGHFAAFCNTSYPAHITALLRKDIERILDESGFAQAEFFYSCSGAIPKLPRLTWQKISAGLLRGVRFSDNVIVLAKKV